MWVQDEECRRVVVESWYGGGIKKFTELARTVKRCRGHLSEWNQNIFGNLQSKIRKLQKELETLQNEILICENTEAIEDCRKQLRDLQKKKEVFWR